LERYRPSYFFKDSSLCPVEGNRIPDLRAADDAGGYLSGDNKKKDLTHFRPVFQFLSRHYIDELLSAFRGEQFFCVSCCIHLQILLLSPYIESDRFPTVIKDYWYDIWIFFLEYYP
jgi:hypothetical protein